MSKLPIVAIVGRPNVGKSSLFNRLVGTRQAIVSDIPGTTRDPVQAIVEIGPKKFWLLDTAGIDRPEDALETDIQSQVDEALEAADVVIVVAAADAPIDLKLKDAAKKALKTKVPVILAVNKIDTTRQKIPEAFAKLGIKETIGTSSIHGYGLDELRRALTERAPKPKKADTSIDLKVAFVGRPNVGKSSLFNRLVGTRQAIVSDIPGTTRDVNRQIIPFKGTRVEIFDTGGIRRSGKIAKNVIERFSLLRTAQAIAEADVCVVVVDANEPSVTIDQKIAGMVKEAGSGLILALNKWDLIRDDEEEVGLTNSKLARDFQFVWWASLLYTSAESGHNVFKLIDTAARIHTVRRQQISTRNLNNLLKEAIINHPPAGLKNRQPKVRYVTQTATNPPSFTFFGSGLDFLHWSYKRYLETRLRETFDFTGTPIRLLFSSRQPREYTKHETRRRTR